MVAFPMVGSGPYGTSRSARSSTTDVPKLDATQIESIFAQVNISQDKVASRKPSWFSRQYNKRFPSRKNSESK